MKPFAAIEIQVKQFRKVDINTILNSVMEEPSIQSQIIDLNYAQLDKGLEADGTFMGNYSRVSVEKFGKRPGPIRLYDTGATRESFKVRADRDSFVITGNMDLHGVALDVIYPKALGLSNESVAEIVPEIKERVIEKFKGVAFS